jgi:hypothetical protein
MITRFAFCAFLFAAVSTASVNAATLPQGLVVEADQVTIVKSTKTATYFGHVTFAGAWQTKTTIVVDGKQMAATTLPADVAPADKAEAMTRDGQTVISVTTHVQGPKL